MTHFLETPFLCRGRGLLISGRGRGLSTTRGRGLCRNVANSIASQPSQTPALPVEMTEAEKVKTDPVTQEAKAKNKEENEQIDLEIESIHPEDSASQIGGVKKSSSQNRSFSHMNPVKEVQSSEVNESGVNSEGSRPLQIAGKTGAPSVKSGQSAGSGAGNTSDNNSATGYSSSKGGPSTANLDISSVSGLKKLSSPADGLKSSTDYFHSADMTEKLEPKIDAFGKTGTPVELVCNYVQLRSKTEVNKIYQYAVHITPPCDSARSTAAMIYSVYKENEGKSYDGRAILYSSKKLEKDEANFTFWEGSYFWENFGA